MKVTRVIVYEGTEEDLRRQLGQSLPDGKRNIGSGFSITVATIGGFPFNDKIEEEYKEFLTDME
jgi:hypothetical protein